MTLEGLNELTIKIPCSGGSAEWNIMNVIGVNPDAVPVARDPFEIPVTKDEIEEGEEGGGGGRSYCYDEGYEDGQIILLAKISTMNAAGLITADS
jgi:hypothetical protein